MLPWRDAGVVDRAGLENRCARKRTEGSNPSLAAFPRVPKIQITWSSASAKGGLLALAAVMPLLKGATTPWVRAMKPILGVPVILLRGRCRSSDPEPVINEMAYRH